jgi:hypothetical protein
MPPSALTLFIGYKIKRGNMRWDDLEGEWGEHVASADGDPAPIFLIEVLQ